MQPSDRVRIDGLDGEVVIHRDRWGIPHARATTAHDAFFAQGYVQAQDRLFQLEYDRRRAHGRWAEVAGARAADFDAFTRRCGLRAAAEREYQALPPDARQVLDAYAAGVNAWLARGEPLPGDLAAAGVEPEPWRPSDCCAVFLVRHVVFASWQKKLWRGRLIELLGAATVARIEHAGAAAEVPLIVPSGERYRPPDGPDERLVEVVASAMAAPDDAGGSNGWALHGSRTASGLPLVAGDAHRLVEVPGVYYQVHLACDVFDAIGFAFVGVPGLPHFGHNEHVAWCVTNANGDYQDLYIERFDDAPQPVRTETVRVRGAEPVTVECYETAHGPVVFGHPAAGRAVSLRSTALIEPSPGLGVLLPMLRARNVEELDRVMRDWVDPVNSFVSADVEGVIAYRTVGRIPVRSRANGWGPVPGWDGRHEWDGTVAYEDMPQLRDPENGLVVTANQRIVDDRYPHYLGLDYAKPERALRLHERLDAVHDATVETMAAVHSDRHSLAARRWVERLVELEPRDEWERAALDRLRAWDFDMQPDSVAAAVYVAARDAACRIVAHNPVLAPLRERHPDEPAATFQPLELRLWTALPGLLAADDTVLLPDGQTWADLLAAALTDAVGVLRTALGDDVDAWRWGDLHVFAPRHPLGRAELDPPPARMGGEWDTVMSASHSVGHGFAVTTSSVTRYVFDLADWERCAWIVPLGVSGDATATHFADQLPLWLAGELVPMGWAWDTIEREAESATRLGPGT